MKSYTVTAAPGTYLLDEDGDATDPVIGWIIGEDTDGEPIREPITPYERVAYADRLLLPDGRVWELGVVFDSQDDYREALERRAEARAEAEAKYAAAKAAKAAE